jgi:hypothetical protein
MRDNMDIIIGVCCGIVAAGLIGSLGVAWWIIRSSGATVRPDWWRS